ncbi:MAG: MBL fold metallo-hydrolase [Clostridia bacterium]|nr:MBL fold metallo-hydrolase [Clostridia bacterium]
MEQKKKLSKNKIRAIIVACISIAIAVALIITNIFVPVKYLASYMVVKNKGAKAGVMRVRFVDMGYGDCTIIELPDGKNMLIDGGNGSMTNESRILKFLNKCDIDVIDYLVCTNVNAEHCGGLAEIVRYKKVKKIYMPGLNFMYTTDEYKNFCISASGSVAAISQYGECKIEEESGYFFSFLSPSPLGNDSGEYQDLLANTKSLEARNNASAVMWLEYAGTSFLFTSDVSDTVLKSLCDKYNNETIRDDYFSFKGHTVRLENCNVLKVADHGSKNALYTPFYDLTSPDIAVISTNGVSLDLMSDLGGCCKNIYRTDEYGTLTIEVTADGCAVV